MNDDRGDRERTNERTKRGLVREQIFSWFQVLNSLLLHSLLIYLLLSKRGPCVCVEMNELGIGSRERRRRKFVFEARQKKIENSSSFLLLASLFSILFEQWQVNKFWFNLIGFFLLFFLRVSLKNLLMEFCGFVWGKHSRNGIPFWLVLCGRIRVCLFCFAIFRFCGLERIHFSANVLIVLSSSIFFKLFLPKMIIAYWTSPRQDERTIKMFWQGHLLLFCLFVDLFVEVFVPFLLLLTF